MNDATMPAAEMWKAFAARDAGFDGLFFVAVKSTGIFCRPSCPARRPRPENVRFFPTSDGAATAGFRPCKRCRPLEANGALPDWTTALFARLEREPAQRVDDADLRTLGLDPVRVRRFFRRRFGMTFHQYERNRRMNIAAASLAEESVESVGFRNGYESSSGFRTAFGKLFGKSPSTAAGADAVAMSFMESPVGPLVLGACDDGLCFLEFSEAERLATQLEKLRVQLGRPVVPGKHRYLQQIEAELNEYFTAGRKSFSTPLHLVGTSFQLSVWRGLLEIPYGATLSYQGLADRIQQPGKQRAVGRANGQNRIAIVVPCHRVVNKSGALGGYGGGLWRKQILLDLESKSTG